MPRKGSPSMSPSLPPAGFNEAGAVMPRKALPLWQLGPHARRFNEAGAVMPRKARAYVPKVHEMHRASMRPGQ